MDNRRTRSNAFSARRRLPRRLCSRPDPKKLQEVPMKPNIADIIRHLVSLEVRCVDRLCLHA